MIPSEEKEYYSCDSVDMSNILQNPAFETRTPDFLNTLRTSRLPNHKLRLKVGTPIMLLRNFDQSKGLSNGTRLIVTRLETHVLEAKNHLGEEYWESYLHSKDVNVSF